jgi:S1-C subfamily serine protease
MKTFKLLLVTTLLCTSLNAWASSDDCGSPQQKIKLSQSDRSKLDNATALLSDAKFSEQTTPSGIGIDNIIDGSVYKTMGIQNRDIAIASNLGPIHELMDFLSVLSALAKSKANCLVLLRNKQPWSIQYFSQQ